MNGPSRGVDGYVGLSNRVTAVIQCVAESAAVLFPSQTIESGLGSYVESRAKLAV